LIDPAKTFGLFSPKHFDPPTIFSKNATSSPIHKQLRKKIQENLKMSTEIVPTSPPLKRKREEAEDDLEINLNLPEPLSKKEARKAKKRKDQSSGADGEAADEAPTNGKATGANSEEKGSKRSDFGIWIGNLPFAVTRLDIRNFLTHRSGIEDKDITRVHMPAPSSRGNENAPGKPKNKGFAYVDFTTAEILEKALALSEELILGRRVLIKNSQSFEGRPKVDPLAVKDSSGKPPSKRIFVGNLDFAATSEDLQKHFSKCGEVADVHVATFEDSGKCKGYAWITFNEIEAAATAVRGWIQVPGGDGATGEKRRFVDRIDGRLIRREFAEDPTVRYNKRYGKGAKRNEEEGTAAAVTDVEDAAPVTGANAASSGTSHDRRREKRKEGKQRYVPHDTAPRTSKYTGAIPKDTKAGKKVNFD
jgi:RNA recognition motif-containing protein